MELYGFMEREKKIPSYFFIITKGRNETVYSKDEIRTFTSSTLLAMLIKSRQLPRIIPCV